MLNGGGGGTHISSTRQSIPFLPSPPNNSTGFRYFKGTPVPCLLKLIFELEEAGIGYFLDRKVPRFC